MAPSRLLATPGLGCRRQRRWYEQRYRAGWGSRLTAQRDEHARGRQPPSSGRWRYRWRCKEPEHYCHKLGEPSAQPSRGLCRYRPRWRLCRQSQHRPQSPGSLAQQLRSCCDAEPHRAFTVSAADEFQFSRLGDGDCCSHPKCVDKCGYRQWSLRAGTATWQLTHAAPMRYKAVTTGTARQITEARTALDHSRAPSRRGKAAQVPTAADGVPHSLPAVAVPVEVAVRQHHSGLLRTHGREDDLDLARSRRVGLPLPGGGDVQLSTTRGGGS